MDESLVEQRTEDVAPRERILHASLSLFVSQGFFNTNVPDISRKSHCSVGSIYHHFLNKEEIASQLYQEAIKQFRTALTSAVDTQSDPQTVIQTVVAAFLTFSEEHQLLSRYLWLARHTEFLSTKVATPTTVGFDQLGRRLTRVIKRGIKSGQIPNLRADIIWSILFGIPLSFVRDWLDGYTKQTPSQAAPMLAAACWAALTGAKPK